MKGLRSECQGLLGCTGSRVDLVQGQSRALVEQVWTSRIRASHYSQILRNQSIQLNRRKDSLQNNCEKNCEATGYAHTKDEFRMKKQTDKPSPKMNDMPNLLI